MIIIYDFVLKERYERYALINYLQIYCMRSINPTIL